MKIGCLGWGSLVWNPGELPIGRKWFDDGPLLPIEFARESNDRRITLVIVRNSPILSVRSLWTILKISDISVAREALRKREKIPSKNLDLHIGTWASDLDTQEGQIESQIASWATTVGLNAVVWTDLPPKFADESEKTPTADEVVKHLASLKGQEKEGAEHYIRMAPLQIDTEYRKIIEKKLGWTPYDKAS